MITAIHKNLKKRTTSTTPKRKKNKNKNVDTGAFLLTKVDFNLLLQKNGYVPYKIQYKY